jgi:hypothetical protein
VETFTYLKDLYINTFFEAARRFKGSLRVVLATCVLAILWQILLPLISPLGMAGGFLRALIEAACLTFYLGWLRDSLSQTKVSFADLKEFDWSLFQSVISILFILFLAQWALQMLTTSMDAGWSFFILQLLFVVLLNSLAEVLYIARIDGWQGVQESFNFTQRNWIEWYLPLLPLVLPLAIYSYSIVAVFAQMHVLLPTAFLLEYLRLLGNPGPFLFVILPALLALSHFIMLFRGVLFKELEGGNRRQRIFRAKARLS